MSLRKFIDLSARNLLVIIIIMKLHFFLKSPDHVHNSFVLYVGYARFSYTVVFKGLASRESLFFLANAGQICFIRSFESVIY